MKSRIIVRLKILSLKRTPEMITEAVGTSCDKSWRIGDRRQRTIIIEKEHGWVLGSGVAEKEPLDQHLKSLMNKVTRYKHNIRNIAKDDRVEVSCVLYAEYPPALNFASAMINDISEMGAGLDIDLYIREEVSSPE